MGLYDTIICEYPLGTQELNDLQYQTKSTDCQLGHYKIDKEGKLWEKSANGWDPVSMTGEIRFYTDVGEWIEWSSYFENGLMVRLNRI